MSPVVPWIWLAGVLHLLIAAANLVVPRKLDYRANLSLVSPIVRQVFISHSVYIVLNLLTFSALCLFFAPDLAGGSLLGAFLSAYMAGFWWLRLLVQLFYLDPEVKRRHPVANAAFVFAVAYLGCVSTVACLGGVR